MSGGSSQRDPRISPTALQEMDGFARRFRRMLRDAAVKFAQDAGDSALVTPETVQVAALSLCQNLFFDATSRSSEQRSARSFRKRTEKPLDTVGPEGPSQAFYSIQLDDAIVDAREELHAELLKYINTLLANGSILPGDLSDGLVVSVLKLTGPGGKYRIDAGRFWQILDQHGPFPPLRAEGAILPSLVNEIERLFAAAENEAFEDGFDSFFSLELRRMVLEYGDAAVRVASAFILTNRVAPNVAAEGLRCSGAWRMPQLTRRGEAFWNAVLHARPMSCADGAVIGLSDLRDPHTISALKAAAAREDYELLRVNMLDLIRQLRDLQP